MAGIDMFANPKLNLRNTPSGSLPRPLLSSRSDASIGSLASRGSRASLSSLAKPKLILNAASGSFSKPLLSSRSDASIGSMASHASSATSLISSISLPGMRRCPKCSATSALPMRRCPHCSGSGKAGGMRKMKSVELPAIDEQPHKAHELLTWLRGGEVDLGEVKKLLSCCRQSANTREKNFGWTPVFFAAHKGDTALLILLLDAHADIKVRCNYGNTALHLAARGGHLDATSLLITKGAELEVQNTQGWTPLMWTAIAGHQRTTCMLMDAGASVSTQDLEGRTACMWAARHGHTGTVCALLSRGIDLSVRDEMDFTVKDHAVEYEKMKRAFLSNKSEADLEGMLDLSTLLMQHGAPSKEADGSTETRPAEEEVQNQSSTPLEVVTAASKRSDDLLVSAKANDWDAVEEALRMGACASTRDPQDLRSPLMLAAMHNAPAAIMVLATARAQLEARDVSGWTALHHASHAGSCEALSVLHHLGADFHAITAHGETLQHLAVTTDAGPILHLIHIATQDLNVQDSNGNTPLQLSAVCGSTCSLRTLLALSANPRVKDQDERSVFALGVVHGQADVVHALLESPMPLSPPWEEAQLVKLLHTLPWVEFSAPVHHARGHSSKSSRSNHRSSGKAVGRKKFALDTIEEANSEANSALPSARSARPDSPHGSDSEASVHSQASALSSVSKISRTSTQSRKSNRSQASIRSKASNCSKQSIRSKASTRSKGSNLSQVSTPSKASAHSRGGPNMPHTNIPSNPVGLLFAAIRKDSASEKQSCEPQVPLVIKELLSEVDRDGRAPLALAVNCGQQDLVSMLLKLGAPVNAVDLRGNTALILAAGRGDRLTTESLLEARAGVDLRNSDGQRAVDIASGKELRRMLQERADRDAVERKLNKSCSLPSLVKSPSRRVAESKDGRHTRYRVRLDGLSKRQTPEHLEEVISDMLEDFDVGTPTNVDVAVDPITLRSCGHAYLNFPSSKHAEIAQSALCMESSLHVSLEAF